MPLSITRPRMEFFMPLNERILKRLSYHSQFLSYDGRLITYGKRNAIFSSHLPHEQYQSNNIKALLERSVSTEGIVFGEENI